MSTQKQEIDIGGVVHLAASAAAVRIGYTSDYVTRLAREQKVHARRIGRQWFIDFASLQAFAAEASRQKEDRRRTLRRERLEEQVQQRTVTISHAHAPAFLSGGARTGAPLQAALLSSGLVMAVVLLALVVAYPTTGASVFAELTGVKEDVSHTATLVLSAALPTFDEVRSRTWEVVTTSFTSLSELVRRPQEERLADRSRQGIVVVPQEQYSKVDIDAMRTAFSDEVVVNFDPHDPSTGVVVPVFEDRTGDAYQFLLVPVRDP